MISQVCAVSLSVSSLRFESYMDKVVSRYAIVYWNGNIQTELID